MKNESGYVSLIVLSVVIIGVMIFTVVYQASVSNYGYVQDSMERLRVESDVTSMVEMVTSIYKEDMFAEVDFREEQVGKDDEYRDLEDFVAQLSFETDLITDDKAKLLFNNYGYRIQEYSKENWITFVDYNTREDGELGIVREYGVERNWVWEEGGEGSTLLLPATVYFQVKFSEDMPVGSVITILIETPFETKEIDVYKDELGENEYKTRVDMTDEGSLFGEITDIQLYSSEESMGSSTFSILESREIGVDIFEKDIHGKFKQEPVARELITMKIGRDRNITER